MDELLAVTRGDDWVHALRLASSVRQQLALSLEPCPHDLSDPLYRALEERLSAAALSQRFRELIAARSERAQLDNLLAFYRSPLGRNYALIDRQARPADLRVWLSEHPISKERRQHLEHWVSASYAMERLEAGIALPSARVERLLSTYRATTSPRGAGDFVGPLRSPELQASVTDHFAYVLRDFPDAALDELVRFESSPAGRWYRTLELDAMTQVIEEAFDALELETVGLRERVLSRYGQIPPAPTKR